jgi:hypothetical protein
MAKVLEFDDQPHIFMCLAEEAEMPYLTRLDNVTRAIGSFIDSPEVTAGQMAWIDDKVEDLWSVADMLEVGVPRAILDVRVELLDRVER